MNIQSYIAMGAMAILSLASLRFNANVLDNQTAEIENKVYLTAFSLADDLIEEIKQKAFDEKTIDFQAIAKNQLSTAGSFGTDTGESWPYFDDIDDYQGYSKEINLPHAEGYKVICAINYVDAEGNNLTEASYFKKATISVTSKYLRYPLNISFIFSLHSKN